MANVSLVAEGARSPQWSKEVEHQRKVGLGSVADVTAPIGLVYATSDADLNGPACVSEADGIAERREGGTHQSKALLQ
jgi:hypothetical protein